MIQEPIEHDQRISQFQIDVQDENGWKTVFEGTTIGYKRLLRIAAIKASTIKLKITAANNTVAIANIGVYKSSEREKKNE